MMQEKYQNIYDVPKELVQNATNIDAADRADASGYAGSLLPPVTTALHRGGKLISFKMDKWGFKDDFVKVSSSYWYSLGAQAGRGASWHCLQQPKHNMTHPECACWHMVFSAENLEITHDAGPSRYICYYHPCRWQGTRHGPSTRYSYHQQPSWQLCALQLPGKIKIHLQATCSP